MQSAWGEDGQGDVVVDPDREPHLDRGLLRAVAPSHARPRQVHRLPARRRLLDRARRAWSRQDQLGARPARGDAARRGRGSARAYGRLAEEAQDEQGRIPKRQEGREERTEKA